jgi:hypothetical protein
VNGFNNLLEQLLPVKVVLVGETVTDVSFMKSGFSTGNPAIKRLTL